MALRVHCWEPGYNRSLLAPRLALHPPPLILSPGHSQLPRPWESLKGFSVEQLITGDKSHHFDKWLCKPEPVQDNTRSVTSEGLPTLRRSETSGKWLFFWVPVFPVWKIDSSHFKTFICLWKVELAQVCCPHSCWKHPFKNDIVQRLLGQSFVLS